MARYRRWYYVKSCPLSTECTKSFKESKVWALTQDEVRQKLTDHYMASGNHYLSQADAIEAASRAEILCEVLCIRLLCAIESLGQSQHPSSILLQLHSRLCLYSILL